MKTYFDKLNCLIDHHYLPAIEDPKDGEVCIHKARVGNVQLLTASFDELGNNVYRITTIRREDVMALYEEINRIEQEEKEMPFEELPF